MVGRIMFLSLLLFTFYLDCGYAAQSGEETLNKANKLFAASRFEDAIPLYEKALLSLPRNVSAGEVLTRIGDSYFRLGDFKKALDAYRSALRLQGRGERAETQYWIGFCCFLLGRDREAVSELLKIPELYPDSGMWVPTAYYWAGRASERMGQKEQAAEYYRKAGGTGMTGHGRYALKRAEKVMERSAVSRGPDSR